MGYFFSLCSSQLEDNISSEVSIGHTWIHDIPIEIGLIIFKTFTISDLNTASLVCHQWHEITNLDLYKRRLSNQLIREVVSTVILAQKELLMFEGTIKKFDDHEWDVQLNKVPQTSLEKVMRQFNQWIFQEQDSVDFIVRQQGVIIRGASLNHADYYPVALFPHAYIQFNHTSEQVEVKQIRISLLNEDCFTTQEFAHLENEINGLISRNFNYTVKDEWED